MSRKSASKTRLERSDKELRIFYTPRGTAEEEEMMRITMVDEKAKEDKEEEYSEDEKTRSLLEEEEGLNEELKDFMDTVTEWNRDMRRQFGIVRDKIVSDRVKSSKYPIPQTPYPNARSVGTRRKAREILLQYAKNPLKAPSPHHTDSMKTLYSKSIRLGESARSVNVATSPESCSETKLTVEVDLKCRHSPERSKCNQNHNHCFELVEPSSKWLTTPDREMIKEYYSRSK